MAPRSSKAVTQWGHLADPDRALSASNLVPVVRALGADRQAEAQAVAADAIQSASPGSAWNASNRRTATRTDLQHWLRNRANDICGTFVPCTGDLFGVVAHGPAWSSISAPLDRLAAFATDGSNPPAQRRAANSTVELFQRRGKEREARTLSLPPTLRQLACYYWCHRHSSDDPGSVGLQFLRAGIARTVRSSNWVRCFQSAGCWQTPMARCSGRIGPRCGDNFARWVRQAGHYGSAIRSSHHSRSVLDLIGRFAKDDMTTREGMEDGGWLTAPGGGRLRAWTVGADSDLDAPHRTGRAYRFSPTRSARRVLLASGERIAQFLTDGEELRLLLHDPSRPDSHIIMPLNGSVGWRTQNLAPDSYRLLLAMATPSGVAALPELMDAARLSQTRVTKELRLQARHAVEGFLQSVLDHPANVLADSLPAETLWQEGLVLVYRLLFILKLESTADPARAFSFASTSLWRNTLSPNRALGPMVRQYLDHGHDTGRMLEDGLRTVFRVFRDGMSCSELSVAPPWRRAVRPAGATGARSSGMG